MKPMLPVNPPLPAGVTLPPSPYVSRYDANGRYFSVGLATVQSPLTDVPPPAHPDDAAAFGVYAGVVDPLSQYHDIASNQPVNFPVNPNPAYTWNWTSHQWEDQRTLAQVQAQALADVGTWYTAAIAQPVAFTSAGGVAQTYQADAASQNNLLVTTTGYSLAGATPAGFYWVAADNTQVPFTLADLKGLYAVMLAQGQSAFVQAQNLKAQIRAATTAAAVAAVVIPAMA